MGASHNGSIISKYLTEFGYTEDDVSDFIHVDPTSKKTGPQNIFEK